VDTKILLIDDDTRVLDTFARTLRLAGYTVITAGNGEKGLKLYRQERPDIVLLDLWMPDVDGLAALHAMREQDPEANVILITGHGDKEAVIDALRAGASDFLPKPIDRVALESALRRAEERIHLKRKLRASQEALRQHNIRLEEQVRARTAELECEVEERKVAEEELVRQEAELRTTLYSIGDGIISTDVEGRVRRMNPVAEQLTGWTETQAAGRPLREVFYLIDEKTCRLVESPVESALRERTVVGLSDLTLLVTRDGRELPIAHSAAPLFDAQGNVSGVVLVFRDQTEERLSRRLIEVRLSLIEYAATHSLGELLTRALDEIGPLVNSPIGFYHFLEPDQTTLSLQCWSTRTLEQFCRAEIKGKHYNIDQAGVWVDCVYEKKPVIHNNYASLPHRKGTPEGHVEVVRELVVPVMREDRVIAILGVGNKPTDYTHEDVELVSYLADVTWEVVRQKRAEEALQASEQRFRDITAYIPGAIYQFLIDPDGTFTMNYVSESGAALFHRPVEELTDPSSLFDDVHPDDLAPLYQSITHAAQHMERWVHEFRIVRPDGRVVWMRGSSNPHRLPDGSILWNGVMLDITERKQMEKALREGEERFREIYVDSPIGIELYDANGELVDANAACLELFGISDVAAIEGFKLFEDPNVPDEAKEKLLRGETVQYETVFDFERVKAQNLYETTRSGTICLDVKIKALGRRGKSSLSGYLVQIQDVTLRKQAEKHLRRLSQRLVEAQEMERRRIARELHDEIGQALTAVKINLQAIRQAPESSTHTSRVEECIPMVERALRQVRDLSLDLRPSLLDDLGLVPALRWFVDRQARQTGITARFKADSVERLSPEVEIVCFRIVQEALTNVARHAQAQNVEVKLTYKNGELELSVQDDGRGFDVAATMKCAGQQESLGLLGMQERTSLAGGQIDVDSEPGRGTTIRARFPIAHPRPSGEQTAGM
jgi:PAS domain S-box-containing protein